MRFSKQPLCDLDDKHFDDATLMSVDDPTDRMDKADGRNVKTKNVFTLSPTALPTLRPQRVFYTTIKKFDLFLCAGIIYMLVALIT